MLELTLTSFLLLVLLGIFIGSVAGLLGIGGGMLMGPIFILYFQYYGVSETILFQMIFATNMFIIIFTSLSATIKYHQARAIIWQVVPPFAFTSILGAVLGANIAVHIPGSALRIVYGLFLLFITYRMFQQQKQENSSDVIFSWKYILPAGLIIGTIGAFLGVGGGIIAVPIMIFFLHFPLKKVAATSSAIIIFTSISAAASYIYYGWNITELPHGCIGFVNVVVAIPVIIGTVVGAPFGAWFNTRLPVKALRMIFGVFLGIIGIYLLFF